MLVKRWALYSPKGPCFLVYKQLICPGNKMNVTLPWFCLSPQASQPLTSPQPCSLLGKFMDCNPVLFACFILGQALTVQHSLVSDFWSSWLILQSTGIADVGHDSWLISLLLLSSYRVKQTLLSMFSFHKCAPMPIDVPCEVETHSD